MSIHFRCIITRCEADLPQIMRVFRKKYGNSLQSDIEAKCKMLYKDLLLDIIKSEHLTIMLLRYFFVMSRASYNTYFQHCNLLLHPCTHNTPNFIGDYAMVFLSVHFYIISLLQYGKNQKQSLKLTMLSSVYDHLKTLCY